jgi:hypothetical protein
MATCRQASRYLIELNRIFLASGELFIETSDISSNWNHQSSSYIAQTPSKKHPRSCKESIEHPTCHKLPLSHPKSVFTAIFKFDFRAIRHDILQLLSRYPNEPVQAFNNEICVDFTFVWYKTFFCVVTLHEALKEHVYDKNSFLFARFSYFRFTSVHTQITSQ